MILWGEGGRGRHAGLWSPRVWFKSRSPYHHTPHLLCYNQEVWATHQKGQFAELKVELRATELGHIVCRPTIEARYDLVLDMGGVLLRVQVKYSDRKRPHTSGAIEVDLRAQTRNNKNQRPYTAAEVDMILIYLPETDQILRINPKDFDGKKTLTFRHKAARNNQTKNIRFVADYLF